MMIQYVLTDIEGTTTSVSFVYDILFPYFKENVKSFVEKYAEEEAIKKPLEEVRNTIKEEEDKEATQEEIITKLVEWTENDRKHPALKELQGIVWKEGYQNGDVKGHLYEDVPPVLEKWQALGIKIGIYSSGSVAAQKLLFGISVFGNLLPYFNNYFDTTIGNKKEAPSYQAIQQKLDIPAENILFLSDSEEELDAAAEAGLAVMHVARREDNTPRSRKYKVVRTFRKIKI